MTSRELRILRALRRHGGELSIATLEASTVHGRSDQIASALRSLHRQGLVVIDTGTVALLDAGIEIVEAMTP